MTVGIVGLGLIGGSIGLALREPGRTVIGCDVSPASEKTALDRFCVDRISTFEETASADLVFVAVPPGAVVDTLERLKSVKGAETVVADCTSAKGEVQAWAEREKDPHFIISHPMAGHEKSGAAYASAWMFRSAKWILSPQPWNTKSCLKLVEQAVKDMGAVPVRMDPAEHDREIARVSHLPHAFAAVLVLLKAGNSAIDVSGGSWRDLTRVAGVDPQLWTQIFMANRSEISKALAEAEVHIAKLKTDLDSADAASVEAFFKAARTAKQGGE